MKRLNNFLSLIFVCAFAFTMHAETLFDKGLKAANEKKYGNAISYFEEVIKDEKSNVSAYFNLGNCYVENKQYGKAIWAYERVLKYSPRDSEAPMNIELCYTKLASDQKWLPHTNGIQRLIYSVGSNTWSILAIAISVFAAFSIFSLLKIKNSPWKRLHFLLLFGETVLLTAFIVAASSSYYYLNSERFGIVTKKSIPTYTNDLGEKSTFTISEGTKLEWIGFTKTKIEVSLSDGKLVLISPDDLEMI